MSQTIANDDSATRGWWIVVSLLAVGFLVCVFGTLREATSVRWQDTPGYLAHTLYIAEHGGVWGFLRECFSGTFPITERHPLYMLLLLPFASRSAEFFWAAKMVDLVTGFVVLLTLMWMVARRFGKGPAIIAGLLYGLSTSLVVASSHVNHETQLVLCTLWAWWFLTDTPRSADSIGERAPAIGQSAGLQGIRGLPSDMPATVARWAIAGVWLGMAYLVKQSAILIGIAVMAAGLWHARTRFPASPQLWAFLATAALVSSPLLVRNLVGFGTPFYEGYNSNLMWLDRWSDLGGEHSIMHYDRYGIMTIEKNGMPTARDYLRTHSPGEIGGRLLNGLRTEVLEVAPTALRPAFLLKRRAALAWGCAVLAFAVVGWWLRRQSWDATLVFFWSGAFLVVFGWDHLFPEFRYLAPVVPVWIAFAALALWTVGRRLMNAQILWRLTAGMTGAVVLIAMGATYASGALTRPLPVIEVSPSYQRLIDWLNRTIEPGDRIVMGPTREFHGLEWMIVRPISVVVTPDADSLEGFQRYLRDRRVRYLLMHREYALGEDNRLRDALAPHMEITSEGAIVEKKPLPGWRAVYADEGMPRRFIVYEAEVKAGSDL